MKKSRYSESQIVKILKEVEGGRLVKEVPGVRHIRCDLLQLEVQVRGVWSALIVSVSKVDEENRSYGDFWCMEAG